AIVDEFARALWHKRYEAGLLSKETYEAGKERQFYAPLQRDLSGFRDENSGIRIGRMAGGGAVQFRGSQLDVIDPFAVLLSQTYATERIIQRNEIWKMLAKLG